VGQHAFQLISWPRLSRGLSSGDGTLRLLANRGDGAPLFLFQQQRSIAFIGTGLLAVIRDRLGAPGGAAVQSGARPSRPSSRSNGPEW
jgi:hypothetical protein